MKKILAIVTFLVFLPFSAFALEMIHDDAMDNVTGQAGITIDMVGLAMNINLGVIGWNDYDGIPGMTGGPLGTIAPRTGATFPIGVDYAGTITGTQINNLTINGGITIDVGQDTAAIVAGTTPYMGGNPFLRIGTSTGNLIIGMSSLNTTATGAINITNMSLGMSMAGIDIGGMPGTAGVAINMVSGITINTLMIQALSWGDTDGITQNDAFNTADNNPGYIGITSLYVSNLPISQGGITIECGTTPGGGAATTADDTKLKIGISSLSIGSMNPLTPTFISLRLQTGTTNALGGAPGVNELGALAISGMNITINAGSEVYIYAH